MPTFLPASRLPLIVPADDPPVLGLAVAEDAVIEVASGRPLARGASPEDALRLRLAELLRRHGRGRPNLTVRTGGGWQVWGDRRWDGGWRIQENVLTGHCRLLAPDQVRHAWGSFAACAVALEQRRLAGAVPATRGHLVILVHGLLRSPACLAAMGEGLRSGGFAVARISYPSTRQPLAAHAARLRELLAGLRGVERVSFVTHSLGALVVRAALAGPRSLGPALGRAVFCFPPNQGSTRADAWSRRWLYRVVMGPVGQELTTAHAAAVPLPTLPFAIIAGIGGNNRRIPGPDDGTVGLAETWLPGAERWDAFPVRHTRGLRDAAVIAATADYLKAG
jgi:hypothetical protein